MAKIIAVKKGSPAERFGITAGEHLQSINQNTILDVLDYKFYSYDRNLIVVTDRQTIKVKKGEGEDLGLEFETYLIDKTRSCKNSCIFCFIDQLPKGMRETLYFKDDDARMSFLLGNYITTTNLTNDDLERIIKMRISPINISVQTTEPDLRVMMMKNPKAKELMNILKRLAEARITINAQIVVCPEVNDGEHLTRSLNDLKSLYPAVESISVVPVGITKHREKLYPLKPVDQEKAREIIAEVMKFSDECYDEYGTRLAYLADELFIKANMELPPYEYYEEFYQLENGVGLIRLFEEEFMTELAHTDIPSNVPDFTVISGVSAAPYIEGLIQKLKEKIEFNFEVIAVKNQFFGETVNVAGLVCGIDVKNALINRKLKGKILIPSSMLRYDKDMFLDSIPYKEISSDIIPCEVDGAELLRKIVGR